jgi:hypothetical protein
VGGGQCPPMPVKLNLVHLYVLNSETFALKSLSNNMLEGFKSLWIMSHGPCY